MWGVYCIPCETICFKTGHTFKTEMYFVSVACEFIFWSFLLAFCLPRYFYFPWDILTSTGGRNCQPGKDLLSSISTFLSLLIRAPFQHLWIFLVGSIQLPKSHHRSATADLYLCVHPLLCPEAHWSQQARVSSNILIVNVHFLESAALIWCMRIVKVYLKLSSFPSELIF